MRIWITGESSFISRNYVSWCEKTKNHEVVNKLENKEYNYFRSWNSGFKNYKHEIDIFDPTLLTLIERANIDVIIHHAGYVGTESCTKNPAAALRTNIEGTYNIINISNILNIPIIFTSTSVCYKPTTNIITEDSELEPQTIYGMTKRSGEDLLSVWSKNKNYITVIPAMLFGAHDLHSGSTQLIMSGTGIISDTVHIALDPDFKKPFMYIDNYLHAIDIILENLDTLKGQRINIAPDDAKPFGQVIEYINETMNLTPDYELHPMGDYLGPHVLSNEKLKSLGWKQSVSLEEGLEKVYSELKEK